MFKLLMSMSRKLQYKKLLESGRHINIPFIPIDDIRKGSPRVVFQGDEGAYSQLAMKKFFGDDVDSIHVPTFRAAMCAISEGSVKYMTSCRVRELHRRRAGPENRTLPYGR